MNSTSVSLLRGLLARSAIARRGGIVVTTVLDPSSLALLQGEAASFEARAETYLVPDHDGEENRGGTPDRWLKSSVGGPALAAVCHSSAIAALLSSITSLTWTPSGGSGTFSYYCRDGHHLGLHRDVEECDLAVLVCVENRGFDPASSAGMLCAYPSRSAEPLSAIRADPDRGAQYVGSRPGDATIILGGIVPHRVMPLSAGHTRVIAPLCFTATGAAA